MSKKTIWISLALLVFVGLNLYLIYKKDSSIQRTNYLSKWTSVQKKDLKNSFTASGVIDAEETNHVFIDPNQTFKQFLVKKGDHVDAGTPLFEYSGLDLQEQREMIVAEQDRLREEAASIDSLLADLESMRSSLPQDSSYSTDQKADQVDPEAGARLETYYSLSKTISEKQLEKEKVQQQIDVYDQKLTTLQNGESNLQVASPYSGTVSDISDDLDNPAITIVSNTSIVKGSFSEMERDKAKEGMKTILSSSHWKKDVKGSLAKVDSLPEQKPTADGVSTYPFTIMMEEGKTDSLQGYHVDAEIITKEADNAHALPEKSIVKKNKKHSVWVLNDEGIVEKATVDIGIEDDGYVEVKSGVKKGTHVAELPSEVHREGPFITKIKPSRILWDKDADFSEEWKYIILGILEPQ
ncbi:efflux RND transporter periplasmic adaptor subunit [Falsibacillus albus]|uniref:Efflux RND transporter periplasmic adaptor subunit n=1 Tax=Falsibacillus albus TaxID=2478915 RepID=A0A3L7K1B8_9BACI|nr:efflux RND transporter periplasmic adaptor subunit [Falsibacillus albus]RLQ96846.1 efflux RND transporter periplasmic adaptor subunit [Falsibacillus albus]